MLPRELLAGRAETPG